jgi:hypothetical protein
MKVLITALALVTLIASPTFAQRQYPGEFYPASAAAAGKAGRDVCQSGLVSRLALSREYPGPPSPKTGIVRVW